MPNPFSNTVYHKSILRSSSKLVKHPQPILFLLPPPSILPQRRQLGRPLSPIHAPIRPLPKPLQRPPSSALGIRRPAEVLRAHKQQNQDRKHHRRDDPHGPQPLARLLLPLSVRPLPPLDPPPYEVDATTQALDPRPAGLDAALECLDARLLLAELPESVELARHVPRHLVGLRDELARHLPRGLRQLADRRDCVLQHALLFEDRVLDERVLQAAIRRNTDMSVPSFFKERPLRKRTYATLFAVRPFSSTSAASLFTFLSFLEGGVTAAGFSPPPIIGPTSALVLRLESGLLLGVTYSDLVMSNELRPPNPPAPAAPGALSSKSRSLSLSFRLCAFRYSACCVGWWW
ncbi:hypothetical protein CMEL01_06679 [Colletotrichum melonis]|uniref:Uncharacterized protein n=1 Tax=Colletotrichum melonis TaxID=1209925 RepID=A0AAI9U5J6_9PEZI|nr:hypothetical protein CMEL01_06679 [Colletotrichum melonis]